MQLLQRLRPGTRDGYDADGLLTKAGDLTLTRDAQLLTGTILGNTATSQGHNGFGELASDKTSYNGNTLYEVHYIRDRLGRIIEKVEAIDGNTTTADYTYDPAGRLTEVNSNGAITAYRYDANGNRLTKTEQVRASVSPIVSSNRHPFAPSALPDFNATSSASDFCQRRSETRITLAVSKVLG